ncbi:6-phosphogluconolactonase [Allostreptomyces psammosilenae]|uniref:6-phosphogluconolactonase n=1 Tax=Allostreptomyces psammosilenae TaxID=1892865 RepID=A0A852ZZJ6_9ACTN|nr:6-phosphogluconolactonase [Allostreptomyces psammosilenae]NYI07247.1 6-phosphogluconolactonase [Allostreptomyces psammosilenae]
MSRPELSVHTDAPAMARSVAAALAEAVAAAQAERGSASVVLTGGRNGNALLAELAGMARGDVDWSRVDLWWGDERFLPEGDADRNATQARDRFLGAVPLDPARVHVMPASDGPDGADPEAAAERYAAELAEASRVEGLAEQRVPLFDVVLLGVGPDAHVASLFPGRPELSEGDATVLAVRNSPKPPPTRVTLTLPAIRTAREVWLLAAGEDKAEAVAKVMEDSAESGDVPAALVSGRRRTVLFVDQAAATKIR